MFLRTVTFRLAKKQYTLYERHTFDGSDAYLEVECFWEPVSATGLDRRLEVNDDPIKPLDFVNDKPDTAIKETSVMTLIKL